MGSVIDILFYAFLETVPEEFFYFTAIPNMFGGNVFYYLGFYGVVAQVTSEKDRPFRLAR